MTGKQGALEGYVVGAYAASAAHARWNPDFEERFIGKLGEDPRIGALELPWLGSLHPHDDRWLIAHFPAHLRAVITDIPQVMTCLSTDAQFGLASPDPEGRARALQQVAALRDDVHRLNDALGHLVVRAVELHSAPRALASPAALIESLATLGAWDWGGADVVIEHCDALRPGQVPEKGFLSIEDELLALRAADSHVGISINWGRSAIELRDADRVVEHISAARDAGRLRGFMASGASDRVGNLGAAWADAHLPFAQDEAHPSGDPTSLLTEDRLAAALRAADGLEWIGVKMAWAPKIGGTVEGRVRMIGQALDALDRAAAITTAGAHASM